jgi:hypothetical protein
MREAEAFLFCFFGVGDRVGEREEQVRETI